MTETTKKNDLVRVFENPEFGSVRMIEIDGEPYFVGKDVAEILGYQNASKALADHVDEYDKLNNETLSSLGQRGGWLINESGLYSLILSSKLPQAKEFKHWVTSEILPSIRKTGSYSMKRKPDSYIIEDPAARARRWAEEYEEKMALAQKLEKEQDKSEKLQVENTYMKPKAAYFDALVDCELLTNFRDTAAEFDISQKEFMDFLKDNKYIYYKRSGKNMAIRAYSQALKEGLFQIKEFTTKKGWKSVQVLVTPKGRSVFGRLLGVIKHA